MDKIISLQELKKHNSQSSVWMVIHNDVYDVTAFLQEHPGGEDTLLDFAGKDGTQGFEDVGHSDDARELLKKYKIGTLAPGERTAHIESCCKPRREKSPKLKNTKSSTHSSECSMCSARSCPSLPRMDKHEKTWRTFDGSPASKSLDKKCETSAPPTPRAERRVQSIVVPRERRPPGPPCGRLRRPRPPPPPPGSKLKWAVLALAGAIVIGFALKKYLNK